ncbi:LamG-like jellyroll fold domain-containing protein [Nonomuraea basaltis]|uniref:LamG-like jellyroll fold domain-containing protein n=1 Tax=Nonomuraea basaltis TaxID=2495887 RepID=UPI0014862F79|nr:LamG-like jellyroll fold domain-containing protein [Nonomuraea basaltis]
MIEDRFPLDWALVDTLTPLLLVKADSANGMDYTFKVCNDGSMLSGCFSSSVQSDVYYWRVPAAKLMWGRQYFWQVTVKDRGTVAQTLSSAISFTTGVRQPVVSSRLAARGPDGQEFDQVTGNYTTTVTDAQVAVVGPPLSLVRSYNTFDPRSSGMFGAGWSARWDMKIVQDDPALLVTWPDGRVLRFGANGDGTFQPPSGMYATLAAQTGGGWRLMDKSSTSYLFDANGRLTKITDARGRSQDLAYDTAGKLSAVTAGGDRSLRFVWTGNHVTSVSTDPVDGTALTWTYTYEADRLTSVCAPAAEPICTRYDYGSGSNYRAAVLDALPYGYWRLNETSGTQAADLGWGAGAGTLTSDGTTLAQPGALIGTADGSAAFNGGSMKTSPNVVGRLAGQASVEAWFKTTRAGTIFSAGLAGSAASAIYIGTDGKLRAQFLPTDSEEDTEWFTPITTTAPVNDGQWHHVVLTADNGTDRLHLDGQLVGSLSTPRTLEWQEEARFATGPLNWRMPAGSTGNFALDGQLDEPALYDRALTQAEVQAHYAAARTDARNKLTKVTSPAGRVWASNTYDAATDRLKTHADQNGGTWQIGEPVYDKTSRTSTVTVTDPSNEKLSTVHDPWRGYRLVKRTDQLGQETTYQYDVGGLLAQIWDANDNSAKLSNDKRGNVISQTTCRSANSCQTSYATYYLNNNDNFDLRNDRLTITRDGRSSSATDNTYATTFEYNAYGEQIKQTTPVTLDFPNGRSLTISYTDGSEPAVGGGPTPAGLVKTRTDARGNVWEQRYTAAGDLAEQVEPEGLVTRYEYDPLGRPTSRTEISQAFPDGVKTALAYDALGQLVKHTGAPVKNEITGKTHTVETRHIYDPDGNKLTDTVADLTGGDPERTVTYTYDAFGRTETVTGPEGGVVRTTWDNTGAPASVTDELGSVFGYTYTKRGELYTRTLKNWTGSPVNPQPAREIVLQSYSYDPGGRLAAQVDAMGRKTSYTYFADDLLSQVIADDVKLNSATTVKDVVLEARTYDAAGHLATLATPAAQTTFAHDAASRLTSSTFDPAGLARKVSNVYDANDSLVKQTLTAAGTTRAESVEFAYNKENQLVRQTVENGETDLTTAWTVDDRGLVTAVVDPRGNVSGVTPADFTTSHRYDAHGRLVEVQLPTVTVERGGTTTQARPTTRYGYDSAARQTHVIDAEGRQSTTAYDRLGRVTSVAGTAYTPPGGTQLVPQQSYAYNAAGQLTKITDPRGHSTTAEYDALGNQVRITDPAIDSQPAGQWVTEYDLVGEPLAHVDPTGARTQATYDDLGRMITQTMVERRPAAAAYTTKFAYTDAGFLTTTTPPIGKPTAYLPNAAGEVTTITDPLGYQTTFGYDAAGRTTKTTTPLGYASASEYDLAGRLTTRKDLDTNGSTLRTTGYGYDANSNLVRTTSGEGHLTTRAYDATNLLTELVEPVSAGESITTTFGYDATGAPTRSTDGRGNSVWTAYNTLGLVETITEPSTTAHPNLADRTWTQSYDAAGNLTTVQQPGGIRIDRHHDALGRMTKETGQGAPVATPERTYRYDPAGRQIGIGDYSLEYNDRSLLTKVTRGVPQIPIAAFTYDDLGNPRTRADSSGNATFTWDDNLRLATAADPVTGRGFTYGYDKNNRLTSLTSTSPANSQDLTYDPLSRPATHTLKNSTGTQLAKITYGWNKDDKLVSKTTEGTAGEGGNTYGYDHAGRLTSWTAPNGNLTTYAWDAAGNRTKAGDQTFTYDERNRLLSGAGSTYAYTPRGTLATQTTGTTTRNLVFDAFDRLISDGEATYTYDALGRLTARTQGTSENRFTYSGLANDITTVTDQTGAITAKYGRDPYGRLLSLQEGTGPALGVMSDQHDDVVATYSGTALVDSVAYSPFGEPIARTGTQRSLGYQGEYTDPDTGKVNMHARWYVPGTGGFASRDDWTLSPDPSNRLNRYLYGQGDPLGEKDPSGHDIHIKVEFPERPAPGFKKGWSDNYCNGGWGGRACNAARHYEERGKSERAFYDRAVAPAKKQYETTDRTVSNRWGDGGGGGTCKSKACKNGTPGKKNGTSTGTGKKDGTGTGKKDGTGTPGKVCKKTICKKDRDGSDGDDDDQAGRARDLDKPSERRCTRNCSPEVKKPKTPEKKPTQPKKQLSTGSSRNSISSSLPPRKTRQERIDEQCRTGPCKDSYSGHSGVDYSDSSSIGRGDSSDGWKKDVVEDITETTTDSIVDAILDDVAPDLPPNVPPGLDTGSCMPGGNSFVPGTKVLMADGSHKPIETIKVGDLVLAANPVTGEKGAKPVTTLITGEGTKHLVKITVDIDGDSGTATDDITATSSHPFWAPALREWVGAGQLQPGMWLQTSAGTYVQVAAVQSWTVRQRVHNLTVESLHTYYVLAGKNAVLTHNDVPGWARDEFDNIVNGRGTPRMNGNAQEVWTGERRRTPLPYKRKWGKDDAANFPGSPEWEVPSMMNTRHPDNYRILGPNKWGDYGYTSNHYTKIEAFPKECGDQ